MNTTNDLMAPVLTESTDGVFIIRLNRPAERNAVNEVLARSLHNAIDEFEADRSAVVAVLTGTTEAFCAGMDLKAYLLNENPTTERGFAGITRQPPAKPIIAAIEKAAVAGGLEIALSCDLIVAARGAKLGVPEVLRALVAAAGALIRLPKRIPYHVAMQMALTGQPITAERAYDLGLVNELTEPGQAFETALALAREIAANGPLAVAASCEIVRKSLDLDEAEAWVLQDRLGLPILDTADAREGALAFAEKRLPVWQGR